MGVGFVYQSLALYCRFICPSTEVFGTASIIWGVIGPRLQFSQGQIFYGKSKKDIEVHAVCPKLLITPGNAALTFFFLIGAVLPVVPWLIVKRYPNSMAKYIKCV